MGRRMRRGQRAAVVVSTAVAMMLAVASCSAGGGAESTARTRASATASATDTTEADGVGVVVAEAAPGLTLEVAVDAAEKQPQQGYDGRWVASYDVADSQAPYTVIVEYYEPGVKSASEVLATELRHSSCRVLRAMRLRKRR